MLALVHAAQNCTCRLCRKTGQADAVGPTVDRDAIDHAIPETIQFIPGFSVTNQAGDVMLVATAEYKRLKRIEVALEAARDRRARLQAEEAGVG